MTPDQMRNELVQVYSGPKWRVRVASMPDDQVRAMYLKMKRTGRLVKHDRKKNTA